jgi:hypothetical protein
MNGITICGYLWIAWCLVWLLWAVQSKKVQKARELRVEGILFRDHISGGEVDILWPGAWGWWHGNVLADTPWTDVPASPYSPEFRHYILGSGPFWAATGAEGSPSK